MPPENDVFWINLQKQVQEIHDVVQTLNNNINGRGGIFDRVEYLEKNNREFNKFMYKFLGGIGVVAILIPISIKIIWG